MFRNKRQGTKGFTLVELLVVVVVIAVLAAVVLPKFINSGQRSKESALKSNLKLMRNAIEVFKADTGYYPVQLSDLAATSAPTKGLDDSGAQKDLPAGSWHGPYVQSIDNDPVTGGAYTYGTTSPNVGKVSTTATGNDSNGNDISKY